MYPPAMPRNRLSELECFVLGLIWRHGPCTAYEVRRMLAESPSTQWSGSAGAIYPLVTRLERRGLLNGSPQRSGKRASRAYSVNAEGVKALRAWIGPPIPPEAVTVTHDPLRSRVRFLGALPPGQRARWARAALEALNTVQARVEAWDLAHPARPADPFPALITAHARLDLAFRRQWLADVAGARGATPKKAPGRGRALKKQRG